MNYPEYTEQNKSQGRWPLSKPDIYNDAREQTIKEAAQAIGITEQALKSMMRQKK